MENTLLGSCLFQDYDSDAHIDFKMKELGHMEVAGQIGGRQEDHYMKFKFMTDQTILPLLIRTLKSLF